jgi:hypothetical protein
LFDSITYRFNPKNKNSFWDLAHRWRRAQYLVNAGKQPSKTYDDDLTRQACRFLRSLHRWKNGENARLYPTDFPNIGAAYDGYSSLLPSRQAEIKARLLAGQGNVAIAERCAIPAEVVGAFHDLFYDVRPHLGDAAVIARLALRWSPEQGEIDPTGTLKLFGYSLGGRAVDALLHYVIALPDSDAGTGVDAADASHKASWVRLLDQVARTLNSRAWHERIDQLLSLVAWLREEGSDLVAESVAIPIARRWPLERGESASAWSLSATWSPYSNEEDDEEPLFMEDDEENREGDDVLHSLGSGQCEQNQGIGDGGQEP